MAMKFLDVDLLDQLDTPEFAELRAAFRTHSYPAKSLVFGPEETDNLVFVVASGRVRLYLSYEGKEFNLGILGRGDIYSTHSGTFGQALEDTSLLMTDLATFRRRMAGMPAVNSTMIRVLGNILRNSFSIIDGLVFKDASHRLISFLANEARRQDQRENGGWLVTVDLPVEQLASLVGATRQTVSTLLNTLFRSGVLEKTTRGTYFIPDIDRLLDTVID